MKPFLILQLREEDDAADNEFEAILNYGQLKESDVHRIRMEKESFAEIDPENYSGVLVGDGPSNVSDEEVDKPDYQKRFEKELDGLYDYIFENDMPYLGSCYGFGSIIKYTGGVISKERYAEDVGFVEIEMNINKNQDVMLKDLPERFTAFCGHEEACQVISEGAVLLGSSSTCPAQMIRFRNNIYATQFHCELEAAGIAERILIYKYHGYFDPDSANDLIEKTKNINVEVPQLILKRFVDRYKINK
jgi:GMP synthase (glutamine-hydrolysing)